jgi:hypothetical protein
VESSPDLACGSTSIHRWKDPGFTPWVVPICHGVSRYYFFAAEAPLRSDLLETHHSQIRLPFIKEKVTGRMKLNAWLAVAGLATVGAAQQKLKVMFSATPSQR